MKRYYYPVLLCFSIVSGLIFSSCSSVEYRDELVKAYYNLGNAYSELGKLKDSAAVYARAIQLDPEFPNASYNLGIVYIQSGNYKRGIEVLEDLLVLEPQNIQVLKLIAWGYFKSGDLVKAIDVYRSVLDIDSYNKDVLNNISILLINESLYKDAYTYLLQLESLGDYDSSVLLNLGNAEKELEISTGLKWYKLAYELDPSSEKILAAYIEALEADGDYGRAVELYDSLITINSDPVYLFNKAFLLLTALEDYKKGLAALTLALESGFSDMERIDELKTYPDLLDLDSILNVLLTYKSPEPEDTPPENNPAAPPLEDIPVKE